MYLDKKFTQPLDNPYLNNKNESRISFRVKGLKNIIELGEINVDNTGNNEYRKVILDDITSITNNLVICRYNMLQSRDSEEYKGSVRVLKFAGSFIGSILQKDLNLEDKITEFGLFLLTADSAGVEQYLKQNSISLESESSVLKNIMSKRDENQIRDSRKELGRNLLAPLIQTQSIRRGV